MTRESTGRHGWPTKYVTEKKVNNYLGGRATPWFCFFMPWTNFSASQVMKFVVTFHQNCMCSFGKEDLSVYILIKSLPDWWTVCDANTSPELRFSWVKMSRDKTIQVWDVGWKQIELEGHSVECIPPPRNAWSMRTYRAQSMHFWNVMLYSTISILAPSHNGEE